jgi:hypothetical protein
MRPRGTTTLAWTPTAANTYVITLESRPAGAVALTAGVAVPL